MARPNTERSAAERYIKPFERVMGCIARGTLFTANKRQYRVGVENTLALNDGDPYLIRRKPDIYLTAIQRFRIVEDETVPERPFRVHAISYVYIFQTNDLTQEVLSYHWSPEDPNEGARRFPHLHIGAGLHREGTTIFSGEFHKKHIPTGRVSFESIILFAIEDLGVPPKRKNYREILTVGQQKFDEFRRKP